MGDEFYAIIKMISGEEVLSLVAIDENDGDPVLVLQNPIIMKMIDNRFGYGTWRQIVNERAKRIQEEKERIR